MSSPGTVSAVTGKVLSVRTLAAYAGDWATILAFDTACPGAPTTRHRRLTAIDHYHRISGYPPTEPGDRPDPIRLRASINPGRVELAMRMLPSHGWTGGLFARRDRALLTLTSMPAMPYRRIAAMTLGQIHVAAAAAAVTDTRGTSTVIAADRDPAMWAARVGALATDHRRQSSAPSAGGDLPDLPGQALPVTSARSHRPADAP